MSGGDGFLTRWSRRKLGAEPQEEAPLRDVAPQATAPAPEPAEEMLPEEELALLPRIEDLTPESDFTAFLRKGVPEALKKAALRRMWALDPAIRDYVGDARDYAWDWNVPGDVPGCGPLLPCDDMGERIERMFSNLGQPEERQPAEQGEAVAADTAAAPVPADECTGPQQQEAESLEPSAGEMPPVTRVEVRPEPAPEAESVVQAAAGDRLRRHGAAIPKFDLF